MAPAGSEQSIFRIEHINKEFAATCYLRLEAAEGLVGAAPCLLAAATRKRQVAHHVLRTAAVA
jgi:hypothetical protein